MICRGQRPTQHNAIELLIWLAWSGIHKSGAIPVIKSTFITFLATTAIESEVLIKLLTLRYNANTPETATAQQ